MSLRHLRRAELEQQEGFRKELKASKSHNALALHSSEESSVPEREATTARRSVFLQAVSSDAESSQEEADNANEAPSPLEKDSSAKNLSPLSFRDDRNDGKKRAKQRNRRKRRAHPAVPPPKDSREAFVESQIEDSLCNVQEEAEASSLPQISGNNSETSSCLYMERGAFDPDAELRRIFGREVLQRSRIRARASTRSRRQWLIAPVECHHCRAFRVNPWVRMVACEDSATGNLEFSLQFTEDYVRVQPAYYAALNSHDLHVLESFCDSHPKHLDGRLALSQALSVTGSHEAAFHMLTIAVCSLQSSFHYAFSPFVFNPDGTPQVSADSRNPLNRQLFACLLLYMIGLGDQGCHRSALEVCKLLLAMDLPNDAAHALLHLDYYALRSEKYDFLQYFAKVFVKQHLTYVVPVEANAAFETAAAAAATDAAVETKEPCRVSDLRLTMPNFAFSAALAYFLKASHQDISAVRQIKAEDVCAVYGRGGEVEFGEYHDDLVPHLLLMHAILLFPAFIRTLLKKLDIKGEQKVLDSAYPSLPWDMLLFSAPLWITGGPIHETYAELG
ncbi:hypothetical protein, conserved [Eimeria tenella]|uniref:Transcription factor 25 n=1 Tax=Eimeria tenella TaxID=5802 RepID=U6L116_EIMTE|nr:hypothetical protein, conserved [Eimeria tenella]CDJ41430.1 hypothetical protein, conserved [Eimeria tenella]|eukprot:XP_013232180.1 hypothetical protein, conserved [Eimeria tenella]